MPKRVHLSHAFNTSVHKKNTLFKRSQWTKFPCGTSKYDQWLRNARMGPNE